MQPEGLDGPFSEFIERDRSDIEVFETLPAKTREMSGPVWKHPEIPVMRKMIFHDNTSLRVFDQGMKGLDLFPQIFKVSVPGIRHPGNPLLLGIVIKNLE